MNTEYVSKKYDVTMMFTRQMLNNRKAPIFGLTICPTDFHNLNTARQ